MNWIFWWHTQHLVYVNVIYNAVNIELDTLLNRAGTAVVVFDRVFNTKRNISVPVGELQCRRSNFEHNIIQIVNKNIIWCRCIDNYYLERKSARVVVFVWFNSLLCTKQTVMYESFTTRHKKAIRLHFHCFLKSVLSQSCDPVMF